MSFSFDSFGNLTTCFNLTQRLFSVFALCDVSICPKPLKDVSVGIFQRQNTREERAENTIGATQRELHIKHLPGSNRSLPLLQYFWQHFRVVNTLPAPAFHLLRYGTGVSIPALVIPVDITIRLSYPSQLWDCISHRMEALFALPQSFIGFMEFLGLSL